MIFIGVVGWYFNYYKISSYKDPVTEVTTKSPQHHFLFIPIQYWVLIMPLFFIWAYKVSAETEVKHIAFIEDPRLGDIYLFNMKYMQEDYDGIYKYGAMKVVAFDAITIQVVVNREFYIKSKGPRIDLNNGKMNSDNYFNKDIVSYDKEVLIGFRKNVLLYQYSVQTINLIGSFQYG